MQTFLAIVYSVLYALVSIAGLTLVKIEVSKFQLNSLKNVLAALASWKFFLGVFLIIGGAGFMFKALELAKFSFVIPLANSVYFLATVIIGYLVFGDRLSFYSYVGIGVVLTGIIIMGMAETLR